MSWVREPSRGWVRRGAWRVALALLASALVLAGMTGPGLGSGAPRGETAPGAGGTAGQAGGGRLAQAGVARALARMDRGFVPNRGQWEEGAAFAAPGYFGTTWVTKDGELRHVLETSEACGQQADAPPAYALPQPCEVRSWVISERFLGGKVKRIKALEPTGSQVSYFIGNDPGKHESGLTVYRELSLGEVWPGVEVRLRASQSTVEKLFSVSPGADLSRVRVKLSGATAASLGQDGRLWIQTGLGEVFLSAPVAWQEVGGQRREVEVTYRLLGEDTYAFAVQGPLDPNAPLVIDPILQSTYLGGSGWDEASSLAIHPTTGEVYVAGRTDSTDMFPGGGGPQPSYGGGIFDAFVARLDQNLTQLLESTYLGGSRWDQASSLAIHPTTGEVYVAGWTTSGNFPNTAGGAQASKSFNFDAFVARLNSSLTQNPQSTYLGGSGDDWANSLAIHPTTGEVYVAGTTDSTIIPFPNTTGGAQESFGGSFGDAFVARLNKDLTANPQSTYLGGSGWDEASSLAIHPTTGEVYVAGYTDAIDFPNTAGGAQATKGGFRDVFVAKLDRDLTPSTSNQSTYLGRGLDDSAGSLAIHPTTGEVYVAGYTENRNFPNTAGGAQASFGGGSRDAFVARLTSDLAAVSAQRTLTVQVAGSGSGSVTSSPAGISCPPTCSARFAQGTTVTLTPTPDPGSTFAGWSGDADCADGQVMMDADRTCTATFLKAFRLGVWVKGKGLVKGPGIRCRTNPRANPRGCSELYPSGTRVTLRAVPAPGWGFEGWRGACTGRRPRCSLLMDGKRSVRAVFVRLR